MNIDELREVTRKFVDNGTSQTALSKLSGVPQSVISLFLSGTGLSVKNYTKLIAIVGE